MVALGAMYQRDLTVSETQTERQSATRPSGGVAEQLLGPNWSASNAAVQRFASALGERLPSAPPVLQRRPAGHEAELRMGAVALQRAVAERRMIARDQDPGPPSAPDWWGLVCGRKEGKWYCTVNTPSGEAEVDLSSLTPEQRAVVTDPDRKNCPPQRWNWFWKNCCKPDEVFDLSQRHCTPVKKEKPVPAPPPVPDEPWDIPPAPPKQPGDYPLPDEGQAYA
jgi:hypothetical protein